jgi:hypothetical protein
VHPDDCHSRLEIANKLLDGALLSKNALRALAPKGKNVCSERHLKLTLTPVRDCWKVLLHAVCAPVGCVLAWLLVLTTPHCSIERRRSLYQEHASSSSNDRAAAGTFARLLLELVQAAALCITSRAAETSCALTGSRHQAAEALAVIGIGERLNR